MKTSTKILLGIGTAAVVGTVTAVIVSEAVIDGVKHCKNRRRVKKFVHEKLGGNKKVLKIVDKLSDNEIQTVVTMLDKVDAGKKKISVAGQAANQTAEDVKETLSRFLNTQFN